MMKRIDIPRHSVLTAVALGAATGSVFLGIGGRLAMRVIGLIELGEALTFTLTGTIVVICLGAAYGIIGGIVLWLGSRAFPESRVRRELLYGGTLLLVGASALHPLSLVSVVAFGPVMLLYAAVLHRTWWHQVMTRWTAEHEAVGELETASP